MSKLPMKKTLLLLATLLAFTAIADAQEQIARPRIGVVLGGGGAKGAAHIGVLKYLEEHDIPVDYIVGTSMGSIIGGMFALGYSPDEMTTIIQGVDWSQLISRKIAYPMLSSKERHLRNAYALRVPFNFSTAGTAMTERSLYARILRSLPSSLMGGSNITNLFNKLSVGYHDSINYNLLPIPFACVATDITTGEAYVMHSGNIATSMRASMAIPGLFDPVQIGSHTLVDGGIVNNFPTDICHEMGADIIIGVEVADGLDSRSDLHSLPMLASQMMQLAVNNKKSENQKLCDIYIHPDISGYNMLSFSHEAIDTLIMRGYLQAQKHADAIERLREQMSKYGPYSRHQNVPTAHYIEGDTIYLTSIESSDDNPDVKDEFERCGLVPGVSTGSDIERAIQQLLGTGIFTNITYTLRPEERPSPTFEYSCYLLQLNLEYAEPHVLAVGLRYNTEESASILLALGFNNYTPDGLRAMLSMRLNYNTQMQVHISYDNWKLPTLNLVYDYDELTYRIRLHDVNVGLGLKKDNRLRLYFSELHGRKTTFTIGLLESIGRYTQSTNDERLEAYSQFDRRYGCFSNITYDNRDFGALANYGAKINLALNWYVSHDITFRPTGMGYGDANLSIKQTHPYGDGTITGAAHLYMRLCTDEGYDDELHTIFGGLQAERYGSNHLPFVGINYVQAFLHDAAVIRYDIRYGIKQKHFISLLTNVIAGTSHSVFTHKNMDDVETHFGIGLQYAARTILGMFAFDIHWSTLNKSLGAALSLGYDL